MPKVDIIQMCVLEFKDRPGSPLFHLEHFIDGHYMKYNSNSGFVEETLRLTPQVTAVLIQVTFLSDCYFGLRYDVMYCCVDELL